MAINHRDRQPHINKDWQLVDAEVSIGDFKFVDITVKEITLGESLLNPALQTMVRLQSHIYSPTPKNFELFKNRNITINMSNRVPSQASGYSQDVIQSAIKKATIVQKVYRLDNREFMPVNIGQTEEFSVHACDQTLLEDAKTLVSKSWRCQTPDSVVKYALQCCKAINTDVQQCQPSRDYIAENIHPFQVITQQANAAVDGNDPSFLHFMHYDTNGFPGKHLFKSLKNLSQQPSKKTFVHYETGTGSAAGSGGSDYNSLDSIAFGSRGAAIAFMFPCDFDLLSDLLNGLDENGMDRNSGGFFNPSNGSFTKLPPAGFEQCGIGGFNYKVSMTNKGTSGQHNACDSDVETHLLKRQGRMSLLDKDKVALRLVAKWQPQLHAGDKITLEWRNKNGGYDQLYGSGEYIISSLIHNIQLGGFATTTMDCVSQTAGRGMV